MIALYVIIGLVLLAGIGLAISYNRFIRQRTLIENSFANADTELRRRYDLIPNLLETVEGYAAHERELFEEVTSTRASAAATSGQPAAAQAATEAPFVQALGRLLAVARTIPSCGRARISRNCRRNWPTPRTASRLPAGSTTPTSRPTTSACRLSLRHWSRRRSGSGKRTSSRSRSRNAAPWRGRYTSNSAAAAELTPAQQVPARPER
jgi:LemA family